MKKEIEEKLRKIGYSGKTDLETILEALPNYTITKEGEIVIYFDTSRKFDKIVYAEKQEDESLVDTAARLMILLHEKGIVKFNN